MKKSIFYVLLSGLLMLMSHRLTLAQPQDTSRIVSLGGNVTEIIYALKQEQHLVGVDNTSLYPEAATQLPQVGYYRSISAEGVVSLMPTMILASEQAGPPKAIEDLKQLGVPIYPITDTAKIDSLYERIRQIAQAFNVNTAGEQLVAQVQSDINAAQALPGSPLKTIMIINRTGSIMAAGSNTVPDELMRLAGVENIFATQQGFKPASAENLINIQPELIIVTEFSITASGGLDALKALPALADSPAVKNNRILVLNDLLAMGLGPRTGEAVRQIKAATLP